VSEPEISFRRRPRESAGRGAPFRPEIQPTNPPPSPFTLWNSKSASEKPTTVHGKYLTCPCPERSALREEERLERPDVPIGNAKVGTNREASKGGFTGVQAPKGGQSQGPRSQFSAGNLHHDQAHRPEQGRSPDRPVPIDRPRHSPCRRAQAWVTIAGRPLGRLPGAGLFGPCSPRISHAPVLNGRADHLAGDREIVSAPAIIRPHDRPLGSAIGPETASEERASASTARTCPTNAVAPFTAPQNAIAER